MSQIPVVSPKFGLKAFNCPFCKAYSNQRWSTLHVRSIGEDFEHALVAKCSNCFEYSIWRFDQMVFPEITWSDSPNADLGEDVQADYNEAASIVYKSPRGAAALLRLSIQKICIQLGQPGKDLNTDIGNLVKQGLPIKVRESLDALRVIGNESVHPGELDLKDDIETATALFKLVNFIAEKMLTEPKEIDAIYNKIPESKKQQIEKRDKVDEIQK